jgi:hypothetical protein
MMADKADIPGKKKQPTPVVFSQETMEEFARIIGETVASTLSQGGTGRGAGSHASTPREERLSGIAQMARDSQPDKDSGLVLPVNRSERSPNSSMPESSSLKRLVDKMQYQYSDASIVKDRENRHEKRRMGDAGLLPSYFGGKIGWQQMATAAIDLTNQKDGMFKDAPFASSVNRAAMFAEENALIIESARHAYSSLKNKNSQMIDFGSRLGAQPGSGFGSSIGPFRPAFINPAARQAIGASVESKFTSLISAGISPEQDLEMKAELADVGFFDSTQDAKNLMGSADMFGQKGGLRELYQLDPRLADVDMLTKGTRYGQNSVEDMTKMMKEIPDAAKAAKMGIEDMVAEMKQAGEQAQETGGNYADGAAAASMFSQTTGMTADAFNGLNQNTLVQGRMFGTTGLPSFMQGLLSPAQKNLAMLDAFSETATNMGSYGKQVLPDGTIISGEDVKVAMLRQAFPELNPEQIRNLMNSRKMEGYKTNLRTAARRESIESMANNGKMNQAFRQAGRLSGMMRRSRDPMGHGIYTDDEISSVKNAAGAVKDIGFNEQGVNIDALTSSTFLGIGNGLNDDGDQMVDFLQDQKGKFFKKRDEEDDKEYLKRVLNKQPQLKKAYITQKRLEKYDEAEESRGDRRADKQAERQRTEANSTSIIDFTPYARKMLRQVDPSYRNKEEANKGNAAANESS